VYVRNFELYDSKGLKDPCGVQPFRIELAPGETKPAMSVEPLDPGGFFYRVRFVYGIVQDTTP